MSRAWQYARAREQGPAINDSNTRSARRRARELGTVDDLDPTHELHLDGLDGGDGDDSGDDDTDGRKRPRRHWPWIVVLSLLLIIIALAAIAGIFFMQAMQVKDDLQDAKARVAKIVPLVKDGDLDGAKRVSEQVLSLTTSANKTVSSDLWNFASQVPWVGANVAAVSETTQATHILVRDAMPLTLELLPLADTDNFKVAGGGINLEPFRAAQPKLPALREVFDEAKSHVDRIDLDAVHPFVRDNIQQLVDIVDDSAPMIDFAEQNLPIVLSVLGGDGPRSYALLFQNLAETRATGGNPAAGAVLTVDNGKVTMREDSPALRFVSEGPKGWHEQSLTDQGSMALFERDTWARSQNYTRTPDFTDTAHLMTGLWGATVGGTPDGIISIDPVVLSYMLSVTGPVTVAGENQKITADNAVKLLLSDTYERFGGRGELADAYFAKVSSAVFSKVMGGGWDPLKMIEQLQKAADEQRVYAWFKNEKEQAMSAELGIDGRVTSDNKTTTQTGVYLNDSSHSKLEYYLKSTITVTCSAEKKTMTTSVSLHNTIPTGNLSTYTLGARNRSWGYPRTTMFLDVVGLALPGGKLTATSPGNGDRNGWDRSAVYKGREAKSLFITVAKGETKTVSFTSSIPDDALKSPLDVRYTPTVTQTPVTVDESCATMFPAPAE